MSLIVGVYVSTGIVISADSRTTGTVTQQVPQSGNPSPQVTVQTNVVLSDAAYKLFLLFKRFAVGTFGDAIVITFLLLTMSSSLRHVEGLIHPKPQTIWQVSY